MSRFAAAGFLAMFVTLLASTPVTGPSVLHFAATWLALAVAVVFVAAAVDSPTAPDIRDYPRCHGRIRRGGGL